MYRLFSAQRSCTDRRSIFGRLLPQKKTKYIVVCMYSYPRSRPLLITPLPFPSWPPTFPPEYAPPSQPNLPCCSLSGAPPRALQSPSGPLWDPPRTVESRLDPPGPPRGPSGTSPDPSGTPGGLSGTPPEPLRDPSGPLRDTSGTPPDPSGAGQAPSQGFPAEKCKIVFNFPR